MNIFRHITAFAAALALAAPVSAHHSDAGLDMESTVTIEGTVKEFAWRNPHAYVIVESEQSGGPVDWEIQMGPVHVQVRRGWTRDSLSPGDQVSIRASVNANGRPYGILRSIETEEFTIIDGMPNQSAEGETPPAESLAGIWRSDITKTTRYPGGFDGFYQAQLTLTDAALVAQAAYNPLSAENPESTCIGRPTPSMLDSTSIYMMEIDLSQQEEAVIIRGRGGSYADDLYGRARPSRSQRTFRHGPLHRLVAG
jgi:hypothetical protein